jgi:hypothetical protein
MTTVVFNFTMTSGTFARGRMMSGGAGEKKTVSCDVNGKRDTDSVLLFGTH